MNGFIWYICGMGICTYLSNLPDLQCTQNKSNLEPLPWPELNTSIKELFTLSDKKPYFIIETGCLNSDELNDVDKIYWWAESNNLHYIQQWGTHNSIHNFPASFLFVSLFPFEINECTKVLTIKPYGEKRDYLRSSDKIDLTGLA